MPIGLLNNLYLTGIPDCSRHSGDRDGPCMPREDAVERHWPIHVLRLAAAHAILCAEDCGDSHRHAPPSACHPRRSAAMPCAHFGILMESEDQLLKKWQKVEIAFSVPKLRLGIETTWLVRRLDTLLSTSGVLARTRVRGFWKVRNQRLWAVSLTRSALIHS
jgi:hypothetical protein